MSHRRHLLTLVVLVVSSLAVTAASGSRGGGATAPVRSVADFGGLWDTTYGELHIVQDGRDVRGTYTYGGGSTIKGHIDGRVLTLRYTEADARGGATFTLSADGQRFDGQWTADGTTQAQAWSGTRRGAGSADAAAARCVKLGGSGGAAARFDGRWASTYGALQMNQKADKVAGTYRLGGAPATVAGVVSGRCLVFRYNEQGATGEGYFLLGPKGDTFAGEWRQTGGQGWNRWTGSKGTAKAGGVAVAKARCLATGAHKGHSGFVAGTWRSTYGEMTLSQRRGKVTGSYRYAGGSSIKGEVVGGCFIFRYTEPGATGQGFFAVDPSGSLMKGEWLQDGSSHWGTWIAKALGPLAQL